LGEKCPFCHEELTFLYVGSHWQLRCINEKCKGECVIRGNSEEDIIRKIEECQNNLFNNGEDK